MIRTSHLALLPIAAALALAGCNNAEEGTSFSVDTGNGAGGAIDKAGAVSIDTPVFKGEFKLPKLAVSAEDFDIDGVHLFPGSRVEAVDVRGDRAAAGGGTVAVRFSSPADPAAVRDWFAREFAKKGVAVSAEPNALTGRTKDEPFRIELAPAGTGRATGTVRIG